MNLIGIPDQDSKEFLERYDCVVFTYDFCDEDTIIYQSCSGLYYRINVCNNVAYIRIPSMVTYYEYKEYR